MENSVIIKTQVEIAAQHIINQVMLNNKEIEEEVRIGVEEAFKDFDFKKAIKEAVNSSIKSAIKESTSFGKIRSKVKNATEKIVDEMVDKAISNFKESLE